MPNSHAKPSPELDALSRLTLDPQNDAGAVSYVAALSNGQRDELVSLADSNHVVMRAFQVVARQAGNDTELAGWANGVLAKEQQRIQNALTFLHHICEALEQGGCPVTVMKSLDHWPDLGNDLDLYTTADERQVVHIMLNRLGAHIEPRSWGDRLANKWNFTVPGLPESVEVHAQRLGQTGEHIAMARRFVTRRVPKTIAGLTFLVPAPEERVIVATLQRMYRHFYFRVCDIVNTLGLLLDGQLDFDELQKAADMGGIWPGVATYLKIVCDYARQYRYRGDAPDLPQQVLAAARFGGEAITAGGKFLRIPILPNGAELYTRQITHTAMRGDVPATLRLSLLPYLASAAAVAFRITGSDKGIW
ncbi:MAG TPA: hypothetical protein VL240_13390 [Candidatus Binatia bacterium]|nr:hypothetical protein [Candidatus Binatia bacterium]